MSEEEFHGELEQRFGLHLGEIKALDKPRAFPLGYFVARSFIAERLALVGDAAHVIHPIAGQGLNMGLKDVAALAEVVVDAARLGIDLGQADVLERYQRWRRFDTMAMGLATNSLNFLFSNESTLLRTRARHRARPGRSHAAAEKPVHPPGRGVVRRSAAAVEGRGVVAWRMANRRVANGLLPNSPLGYSLFGRLRAQSIFRASSGSMIGMPSRIG